MIKKVLIPNRGEIAVRLIKAAHKLGIKTVVTLFASEQLTLPAKMSDEVHIFEEGPLSANYLNIPVIINLAKQYGADAIHPGYGFLSENHLLAEACIQSGITFVGPAPEHLKLMGDKDMARQTAQKAGVSLTRSWTGNLQKLLTEADSLPYPVMIKAAMGGGGKGMSICNNKEELLERIPELSRQAERYFGDDRLYVEQYISQARHIEIQVLADHHGNHIHLFERECSIQRRFQKIIEEAPAINLDTKIKEALYADALRLCDAIGYHNAGTVEFLVDRNGQHYFLEMNTRIQVEHGVTEYITGTDIVEWQYRISNNEVLTLKQEELAVNGHAIELRLCAEDPATDFSPSPGTVQNICLPETNNYRLDSALDEPQAIPPQFDPLVAKIIVHGKERGQAIEQASFINSHILYKGIKTNQTYLNAILENPRFRKMDIHTGFCDAYHPDLVTKRESNPLEAAIAYTTYRLSEISEDRNFWRIYPLLDFEVDNRQYRASYMKRGDEIILNINNKTYSIRNINREQHRLSFNLNNEIHNFYCFDNGHQYDIISQLKHTVIKAHDRLGEYIPDEENEDLRINSQKAPIPGRITKIMVHEGQEVKKGDVLIILDAMKTENRICAGYDAFIDTIMVKEGEQVGLKQELIKFNE